MSPLTGLALGQLGLFLAVLLLNIRLGALLRRAGKITFCARQPPHRCGVDGPCNGWPR